jgi:hypothetical protein
LGREERTKVGERSGWAAKRTNGEGLARRTTLTLVAARLDLDPLFAAQARKRGRGKLEADLQQRHAR